MRELVQEVVGTTLMRSVPAMSDLPFGELFVKVVHA